VKVDAIGFNFKDAPIDQVLDFISRESGVPIINEAPTPQGTITFISSEKYTLVDAMSIVNLNLARFGVHLRREAQYLYLATLAESTRRPTVVATPDGVDRLTPDQIVTVNIPLDNARVEQVLETVKQLVSPIGGVLAVPAQNMLIVVESAAQVRRIREVVESIDSVKPADSAFKLFPLKHAQAETVLNSLRGLVGERSRTVIVDKDGSQRTVQDTQVQGLNIQADPRTNSIIAVGPEARLRTVEEVIRLLDVPESDGGGGVSMATFALAIAKADDAARQVTGLFANVDPKNKPVVLALAEQNKVTVVGAPAMIARAGTLLGELDPGSSAQGGTPGAVVERRAVTMRLKHAAPATLSEVLTRLATPRQQSAVRTTATPDGRGLIIIGPAPDVEAFEQLVASLDVPDAADREVRLIRLTGDAKAALARASELYAQTGKAEQDPVKINSDEASKTAIIAGSKRAVAAFDQLLATVKATGVVEQESRRFELVKNRPSVVAAKLQRLARPLLTPDDGSAMVEPIFEPIDEMGLLIVRARPEQLAVLSPLVAQLDGASGGASDLRVVRLTSAEPTALLDRAKKLYDERIAGSTEKPGPVGVEFDARSGAAILTGSADALRIFGDVLTQAQQLVPPMRTTRVVDVQSVDAAKVLEPLKALLAGADSIDPARAVPEPTIQRVERTNSLLVTAEAAQHALIADFILRLDRPESSDVPPIKLLQLRTAEAPAIAAMLTEQYSRRPQSERLQKPVDVRADAGTNTLIVTAHPDLFDGIRTFVEELNKESKDGTNRVTKLFPLKVAKAADVATAMDRLFPEPPMPTDRLGRPQPWLRRTKDVLVSAEAGSNSLIIDAPQERMESLQELAEKLDRVELPPQAQLRTYRIVGPGLEPASRTLRSMADKGVLSEPPQPGKPPVQVLIEIEPKSGTLIIAGDAKTFEITETLLKELSLVPIEKGLRIFPIASEDAENVRTRALAIYDAQVKQIPSATPIEVTVDASTNSLMVVAATEEMARFARVMDELGRQAGPGREVRLLELRLAKAEEVVGFLRDLVKSSESMRVRGGPEPVFEVIEATNQLMIAAQPGQFPVIEALAKSLDSKQQAERPPLRILRLRSTEASNLATVLQASYDARPAEERGKKPVSIQADPATNTLIVSAHEDLLPEIETIVSNLNETERADAEGREIRIFPLKIARAEELAQTLDQMFPEPPIPVDPRTRQPRPDLKPSREVVVRADRATNSIIVDAPAKRLPGFEQLVKSLDQQKLSGSVVLRTYRVERADLTSVAQTLRELASAGSLNAAPTAPVGISVDASTRTLIVSAPQESFAAVEDVLRKLDGAPDMPATEMKLYALTSARAERLQPLLQKLLTTRVREQMQAEGKTPPEGVTLVEVVADMGSNALIITAPREAITTADGLVRALDQQSVATGVEVRVFRLKKGEAATVALAVQAAVKAQSKPGEPEAQVTPEPGSNTIVVVGTRDQIEKASALVEEMDASLDRDGLGVRTITLKHARAEMLAPVMQQVLTRESAIDRLPEWARMQAIARGAEEKPLIRVAAEPRLNALIVSGPMGILDMAEQVAATLDVQRDGAAGEADGSRMLRVITLKNADAQQLATNLGEVFKEDATGTIPPTIRVDLASNSLIVRADASQMKTVEELTGKLDAAAVGATRQLRMVPLDRSRVDAEMMARTLQRLMEQQGGTKVEIISTEELIKRTKDGEPAPKAPGTRSDTGARDGGSSDAIARGARSPAGFASGVSGVPFLIVAGTLGVIDEPAAAMAEPEDSQEPEVTIAVDRATNSLVIVGSPRAGDRVAALAAELERQMPAEPVGVRVVTLPAGLDADLLMGLVRQTVTQIGRMGPANPGGFSGPVSVMQDPAGSSLIVLSGEEDFDTVAKLITSFSQTQASGDVTVKVYPLASVTASRAIEAIRDLLSPEPRGSQARRLRTMRLSVDGADGTEVATATIDPAMVRMTSDPGGTSIVVAAPKEALPLIDRLIETLDQSPVKDRLAIRRYVLTNARSRDLSGTLQELFDAQRQGPGADEQPQARFVPDERTNSLLVTASDPQHKEIVRLLEAADTKMDEPGMELAIITLQQASPATVEKVIAEVLIGRDPGRRERIRVAAEDGSSLLVVRAPKEELEEIRAIVAQVDQAETSGLPVRSIKLERADANQVAAALQRFFQERANVSSRPGRRVVNRVAVVGDKRTSTVIVSASDEDFEQVKGLVATFDTPAPSQDFQFKVIRLTNARVSDVVATIKDVIDELRWTNMFREGGEDSSIYVEGNERANSIVAIGRGEAIQTVERVIGALDQPPEERAKTAIKAVRVKNADLNALRTALTRAFTTPRWPSWRGPDPEAITVEIDRVQRALILVGASERVEQAAGYIAELDGAGGPDGPGGQRVEFITLSHAPADRAAQNLRQFFADRARAQGLDGPGVTVVGSRDGNVVIASGDADSLKSLKDLVAQIDQPDGGKDRRIEVIALQNSNAADTAGAVRAMFARDGRDDQQVIVTPQPSTNSLIVSAPNDTFAEVRALLTQLDAPPTAEGANMETVALTSARAQDVATALKGALPPNIKVTVTPVVRSNSLLLTGGKEAIALVMEKIKEIDKEPVRSGLAFRRFKLTSAESRDVAFTLSDVLDARPLGPNEPRPSVDYSSTDNTLTVYAPADQMAEVERIIAELDQATGDERATEFVKLQFANAQQTATALRVFYGRSATEATNAAARNVTILHDALSNSLVIRADKSQWEGIRALLAKLDTEEYDTTRQLAVIALEHADAESVARALNEGLRAPLEEQLRQAQIRNQRERGGQGQNNRDQLPTATVLVDAEGVPTVSAERLTNSLIVFAGQKELARIREIVKQLDVAGFAEMPAARIIEVRAGRPSAIATTIREMFLSRSQPLAAGPRSVLIIGDDASSAIIVRADDEKFAQIKALADALQQQGESGRVSPHVLRLKNVAAGRLRQTILTTFTPMAQAQGETLAVEIDRSGNALVIACSPRLLEEIRKVVAELDQPIMGAGDVEGAVPLGQSVAVVDVANNAPERIVEMLEALGVTRAQAPDRPGVVGEPVALVVMSSRRAIAVMGAAGDARAIEALVRTLDAQPVAESQQLAVIPLKLATASTLAQTLTNMLNPTADAGQVGGDAAPGRALAEQVRRLNLVTGALNQPEGAVDLTKPIRILSSNESNALIIASTQANIDALRAVVTVMDTLPAGEAVLVRIFPLDNASATRAKQVVDQLFTQGDQLRRVPGTTRQGLPTTATGRALAGEISTTVDERTNTLIVAGREEAVALVEVLIKDLDSDGASKWVEPLIIPLKYADASDLAVRLRAVLVAPTASTPDTLGLQRQFGRLRMIAQGAESIPPAQAESGAPLAQDGTLQSDLFAPLTGLVIVPEEQLNALLVVGSPANNAVVRALVAQLDVEQASAKNTVRVFPLRFAAADRVAGVVRDIFRQRAAAEQQRPEDALIVSPDARTNSLIVSTSPKSFAILDGLLNALDGEKTNFSVGLHVIPVTNADARQLAPRIERLMRERLQAAAVSGSVTNSLDAFSIEAEPTSNLLIVAASAENLTVVKELLAALTSDVEKIAGLERMDVIQLGRARAAEIIPALNELYVEKENQRRGPGAVRVTPNERLNAVIVSGNEQDLIELRALAKRLDTAEIAQKQQIRWIELKSASAGEVVRLLQSVLAGRPVSGGGGVGARQATKLQFLREKLRGEIVATGEKPTEADLDGAIKDQVTLNADSRTNAVWITAPEPVMNLVIEMIEDIEKSAAGQRKIEKFRLVNADAARMRALLRDIFNLEQRGDALVLVPVGQEQSPDGTPAAGGLNGGAVTPVPDERQQLSIAVDLRTNTLIVSGTPDYIDLVRQVVTELDSIEANDRERRVYHLRNAKAKDIEATLRSYFTDETNRERSTLGTERAGSLMRMLEEEVTVVGDLSSNKIVISTSPRYMTSVLEIVKELDASPPQVMIQVLLAEVTIDGRDEWGMDFQVGPFGGEGYQISSSAAGSGVTTAIGVPNLAVTSADFGVLIRALESQGKLEVLSNPQVMVNNNQPAEIKVIDEIGVASETERTNNGLISGVDRIDAGIILNVTPSISADGFVRMEIKPEISSLTSRITQINADQTSPIITRRTIDTVVTVKDGQSVVIGGLIQTSEETRRTKVPIIGDIPILGIPFNSTEDETRKTELMVILTPRVIPGQSEDQDKLIRDVTEQSIDRLENPTKIQDYLERIKSEVRRKRASEAAQTPAVLEIPVQGIFPPATQVTPPESTLAPVVAPLLAPPAPAPSPSPAPTPPSTTP
jgi:type II secretion system protein D